MPSLRTAVRQTGTSSLNKATPSEVGKFDVASLFSYDANAGSKRALTIATVASIAFR